MTPGATLKQPKTSVSSAIRPNHTRCRICDKPLPEPFLDLGLMPLANAFSSTREEAVAQTRHPLAVCGCLECGFVQLNHVVPAEQLYRHYLYVSSTSDAVRAHAQWLAQTCAQRYGWSASDRLVEVASNDGTVLKAFQAAGIDVLGVEPARNIAALAEKDGVPTVPEFFNAQTARQIRGRHGKARGLLGRHVFAHIDDVHDFFHGVERLLADDGVAMIEVPYLRNLIANLEFDTIYHEHLSYIGLLPIAKLCRAHGWSLFDADEISLHGGSIILHMRRGQVPVTERLERLLTEEEAMGLASPEHLQEFGRRVLAWKRRWSDFIAGLANDGASIVGYGAAAKGSTLLNFAPEAGRRLSALLDRSAHKQGRYSPGLGLPVAAPDAWRSVNATHMILLAWNFKDEIMRQMHDFAQTGGAFVMPVPEPEVVAA